MPRSRSIPHRAIAGLAALCCASAFAMPSCPQGHFSPSANFGVDMYFAKPLPAFATLDDDLKFFVGEIFGHPLVPGDMSAYGVYVFDDGTRNADANRVVLLHAPAPKRPQDTGVGVFATRRLSVAFTNRIRKAAAIILSRTRYDIDEARLRAPDLPASDVQRVHCLDGSVVFASTGPAEGYDDLAGEAYLPGHDTEVDAIAHLGRALGHYVLHQADDAALEAAIVEVEAHAKP